MRLSQWGDVAIGVLVRAGEDAGQRLSRLRTAVAATELTSPRLNERLDVLARRGAAERARIVDSAIIALATAPIVDRVVEIQLDRILEMLEREPDRIRALVRGQRDSMVGDVVGRFRAGAAAGDDAVDRLTLRWTRNGNAETPT